MLPGTLFFQTALPFAEITFFPADGAPPREKVFPSALRGEELADEILSLLAGEKPARVATVVGPGGFTGVRVAVAAANAIAFAAEIPAAGVSSFNWLRARVGAAPSQEVLLFGGREILREKENGAEIEFLPAEDSLADFLPRWRAASALAEILALAVPSFFLEKPSPDPSLEERENSPAAAFASLSSSLEWQEELAPRYARAPTITPSKKKVSFAAAS